MAKKAQKANTSFKGKVQQAKAKHMRNKRLGNQRATGKQGRR